MTFDAYGALDGTSFNDALVTIVFTGDTGQVSCSSGDCTLVAGSGDTVTVNASGVTDTFADPIEIIDKQSSDQVGFIDLNDAEYGGAQVSLVALNNTAFATYELESSIGPDSGGMGSGFLEYTTSEGYLNISSFPGGATGTFDAAAAPEPTVAALVTLPLVLMPLFRRKLRRAR